jgi:hypothetical protein
MSRAYSKNGRRNDSKKGCKLELPYHKTSRKAKNQMRTRGVERCLQLLGIRECRSKDANRDEWRCLMREAKARKVL